MEFMTPSTKTEQKLFDVLKDIWPDNADFVNGVLSFLVNDTEREWMLEAIETKEVETTSDIILYGLQIEEDRGQNG